MKAKALKPRHFRREAKVGTILAWLRARTGRDGKMPRVPLGRRPKMKLVSVAKFVAVFSAGWLWSLSPANASVVIQFEELPNEAGIHLGGFDINGNMIDLTKGNGAETFHLSSPDVPTGYSADATLSHIGNGMSDNEYLVNILESAGGPISDQVWVHQFIPSFTVIDFISDPDQFVVGVAPSATIVETGLLQHALVYNNDRGELVSIDVLSDVDAPEPATLALFGFGLAGLGWARRKRRTA